jgi:hypothetical protein
MLTPSATISKLVSDPGRCRLYGLAGDRILVIDTKTKAELAPIMLSSTGNDVDVAADGSTLVVAHRGAHELTVLDPAQEVAPKVLPLPVEPGPVEVTATGVAFYTTPDRSTTYRIGRTGVDSTPMPSTSGCGSTSSWPPMTSPASGVGVVELRHDVYDARTAPSALRGRSGNFGFSSARRHVMVSRSGNAYFEAHQWLAHDMTRVTGSTIENVLAESDSGRSRTKRACMGRRVVIRRWRIHRS